MRRSRRDRRRAARATTTSAPAVGEQLAERLVLGGQACGVRLGPPAVCAPEPSCLRVGRPHEHSPERFDHRPAAVCGHHRPLFWSSAEVAELADAPDSKSGEGNLVWVQVPPSALAQMKSFPSAGGEALRQRQRVAASAYGGLEEVSARSIARALRERPRLHAGHLVDPRVDSGVVAVGTADDGVPDSVSGAELVVARAAVQDVLAGPPTSTSLPTSPWSLSEPASPLRLSLPSPPARKSSPGPPWMSSSPSLPRVLARYSVPRSRCRRRACRSRRRRRLGRRPDRRPVHRAWPP